MEGLNEVFCLEKKCIKGRPDGENLVIVFNQGKRPSGGLQPIEDLLISFIVYRGAMLEICRGDQLENIFVIMTRGY